MNRLLVGVTAFLIAACQAAAPASPSPTAAPTSAPTTVPTLTPSTPPATATPSATPAQAPSPTVAGKLIAYDRGTPDGFQLELVGEGGGQSQPLSSPDRQVPRWSPDGQWIAVAYVHNDTVHAMLVRPDGSDERKLKPDETLNTGVAAWTPDGQWVATESWDPSDASREGVHIF